MHDPFFASVSPLQNRGASEKYIWIIFFTTKWIDFKEKFKDSQKFITSTRKLMETFLIFIKPKFFVIKKMFYNEIFIISWKKPTGS